MTRKTIVCTALMLSAGLGLPRLRAATLDDCFQDALVQSETLAESGETIYQAREQYHQAIAAVLPNVSLNYTYLRQDDHAYTSTLDEFSPAQQNTATVMLDQPLFRGFAEYAALREVKDSLRESRDARRWAAMQVYQDVAQAFFEVLSLEHSRELLTDQIKDYDKQLKEEKDFYAIGRARNSDLETVEADKALLEAAASQTDEQIAVEREVLAFLTGQSPDLKLEAADQAPDGEEGLDSLLKNLDQRPDIHAALMQDKAAEELVSVSKGAHLPSIDLIGNWYPGVDVNHQYQIQRPGIDASINWDAEITATLPLFEGGALFSKDRQAESVKRQADLNLSLVRRQAISTIRTQWKTLAGDLAQIKAYDEGFKLSYKAYTDLNQDYKNGLDTTSDVMIALTAAWVSKQSLEAARFNARNDFEQLETVAGQRLYLYPDDQDEGK